MICLLSELFSKAAFIIMSQIKTSLFDAWPSALVSIALLALASATFPKGAEAQRASVSTSTTNLAYYSFVNGGGVEIGSNVGLTYSGDLNTIVQTEAGPIQMMLNNSVMINGVPERMREMNKDGTVHQHLLSPGLSRSTIDLNDKTTVSVRIGGTLAVYRGMMYQSQNRTNHSASGQSLSVFSSLLPSVFSSNAGQ